MRLRTVHKRARRHKRLTASVIDRILLCNRFAACSKAYQVKVMSYFDFGKGYDHMMQAYTAKKEGKPIRYYFKGVFYTLKDRIMDAFGKPAGYSLQYWTSAAEDFYGDEYLKDGCHHYQILERVRLGKHILHRPTGHFSFSNDLTGYYKESKGFDEIKKQCVETIEGKKREHIQYVPEVEEARKALTWLAKRFGRLPLVEKPQPKVTVGDSNRYYFALPSTTFNPKPVVDDDSIPFLRLTLRAYR